MILYQHNQGRTVGSASTNAHQRAAAAELQQTVDDLGVDILLLQDVSNGFKNLAGFKAFCQPSKATAILTRDKINASPIPRHSRDSDTFSATSILVGWPGSNQTLRVASVYRKDRHGDPNSTCEMEQWLDETLSEWADSDFVLGGDLNVKHPQ
jgi:hypothetical protein